MEDNRVAIIVGVAIVSLGGLPLLYYLHFDFNPINLRSPKVESIATFLDLRRDPITGTNAISVLAKSLPDTAPIVERLSKVPEVAQVRTLNYFVPADQDKKLAAIAGCARQACAFVQARGDVQAADRRRERDVAERGS